MKRLMKNKFNEDNSGMSLIEIIVVVAILLILAGGAVWGLNSKQSSNVKDAAQKTQEGLEDVRLNTLSREGVWTCRIYNDDGTCKVLTNNGGTTVKTRTLGGSVAVSIDTGTGAATLGDKEFIEVSYEIGSGKVKSLLVGKAESSEDFSTKNSVKITVAAGGSSIDLTLWCQTGKVTR